MDTHDPYPIHIPVVTSVEDILAQVKLARFQTHELLSEGLIFSEQGARRTWIRAVNNAIGEEVYHDTIFKEVLTNSHELFGSYPNWPIPVLAPLLTSFPYDYSLTESFRQEVSEHLLQFDILESHYLASILGIRLPSETVQSSSKINLDVDWSSCRSFREFWELTGSPLRIPHLSLSVPADGLPVPNTVTRWTNILSYGTPTLANDLKVYDYLAGLLTQMTEDQRVDLLLLVEYTAPFGKAHLANILSVLTTLRPSFLR